MYLYLCLFPAQKYLYNNMNILNRFETNCAKSMQTFHAIWGLCFYNLFLRMICCSGFDSIFLSNRCSRECGEQLYWCTWSDWSGFAACTQAGKLIKPWIGDGPGFLSLLKTLSLYNYITFETCEAIPTSAHCQTCGVGVHFRKRMLQMTDWVCFRK